MTSHKRFFFYILLEKCIECEMDRICKEMGLQRIWEEQGLTGRGITIAVLDTGIGRHPDLQGKVSAFKDFVNKKDYIYDDNGHGSHIAGIICGSGRMSGGRYGGIAPGASLVVGKVLDRAGGGSVDCTMEGLEWILSIRKKYNIKIINLSIGIADLKDEKKRIALEEILYRCWKKGIFVVTAAGNNCKEYQAKSLSRNGGNAIIVGTTLGGPCNPDIIAPGDNIISCDSGRWYTKKSGSSMATPIVSACGALIWEKESGLTNIQLKERMKATAQDLKLPWHIQGWGMINLRKLLT